MKKRLDRMRLLLFLGWDLSKHTNDDVFAATSRRPPNCPPIKAEVLLVTDGILRLLEEVHGRQGLRLH